MQPQPAIFEEHEICRVYDEAFHLVRWGLAEFDALRLFSRCLGLSRIKIE